MAPPGWMSPREVVAGWLMNFGTREVSWGELGGSTWYMSDDIPPLSYMNHQHPGMFIVDDDKYTAQLTEVGLAILK